MHPDELLVSRHMPKQPIMLAHREMDNMWASMSKWLVMQLLDNTVQGLVDEAVKELVRRQDKKTCW